MPDKAQALAEYRARAGASGAKLVDRYTRTPGKAAAIASDASQAAFEAAMRDPAVLKRRQAAAKRLTEDDLNRAMEAKGAAAYAAGIEAGAEKWLKEAGPYMDEADRISKTLPPRSRDPRANISARLTPVALGLHELKKKRV